MRYASFYKLALISASLVMVLVCASLVEAQCGSNTKAQPASNHLKRSLLEQKDESRLFVSRKNRSRSADFDSDRRGCL